MKYKCSVCEKEIESGAWFYISNPDDHPAKWYICLPICPRCMLFKLLGGWKDDKSKNHQM